jgi:hypothetical protein
LPEVAAVEQHQAVAVEIHGLTTLLVEQELQDLLDKAITADLVEEERAESRVQAAAVELGLKDQTEAEPVAEQVA